MSLHARGPENNLLNNYSALSAPGGLARHLLRCTHAGRLGFRPHVRCLVREMQPGTRRFREPRRGKIPGDNLRVGSVTAVDIRS